MNHGYLLQNGRTIVGNCDFTIAGLDLNRKKNQLRLDQIIFGLVFFSVCLCLLPFYPYHGDPNSFGWHPKQLKWDNWIINIASIDLFNMLLIFSMKNSNVHNLNRVSAADTVTQMLVLTVIWLKTAPKKPHRIIWSFFFFNANKQITKKFHN